jgi:hypothetical protein
MQVNRGIQFLKVSSATVVIPSSTVGKRDQERHLALVCVHSKPLTLQGQHVVLDHVGLVSVKDELPPITPSTPCRINAIAITYEDGRMS